MKNVPTMNVLHTSRPGNAGTKSPTDRRVGLNRPGEPKDRRFASRDRPDGPGKAHETKPQGKRARVESPPTSPQVTISKPWGQPACAGGREIQKTEALDPKWPETSEDSEKPCSCDRECSDQEPSPPTQERRHTSQCIPHVQPLHPKPSECNPQLSTQVPSPRNACTCACVHRRAGACLDRRVPHRGNEVRIGSGRRVGMPDV